MKHYLHPRWNIPANHITLATFTPGDSLETEIANLCTALTREFRKSSLIRPNDEIIVPAFNFGDITSHKIICLTMDDKYIVVPVKPGTLIDKVGICRACGDEFILESPNNLYCEECRNADTKGRRKIMNRLKRTGPNISRKLDNLRTHARQFTPIIQVHCPLCAKMATKYHDYQKTYMWFECDNCHWIEDPPNSIDKLAP